MYLKKTQNMLKIIPGLERAIIIKKKQLLLLQIEKI